MKKEDTPKTSEVKSPSLTSIRHTGKTFYKLLFKFENMCLGHLGRVKTVEY